MFFFWIIQSKWNTIFCCWIFLFYFSTHKFISIHLHSPEVEAEIPYLKIWPNLSALLDTTSENMYFLVIWVNWPFNMWTFRRQLTLLHQTYHCIPPVVPWLSCVIARRFFLMTPHRLVCWLLNHILVNLAFCSECAMVIETTSLQMLWFQCWGETAHKYLVMTMLLFFVGFHW